MDTNIATMNHDLEMARDLIANATRVLVLTGAGISAESGVPTFRGGGGSAVWRGRPFEELSSAQMVEDDLPLVWEWFDHRRGIVSGCEPNPAHQAIAEAQNCSRFERFTLVTQNIDGLHRAAGSTDLIELHGHIHDARCLSCGAVHPLDSLPPEERPPVCPVCGDSMRPHVVLFGEILNEDDLIEAYERAAECEVCVVAGTSGLVYPAMHIPVIAKREGAFLVEVNLEGTPLSSRTDVSLLGKAGEILPLLLDR
jgi:NAD-dependent deacetylase